MTILVGNAPCSWGTLEFNETASQRYTYTQMLDELAATGYTGTELGDWGFMPVDPAPLAAEFRARSLDLTGAFVGVNLRDPAAHRPGEEAVVKTARLLQSTAAELGSAVRPFVVLADDNCRDPQRTLNAGRITPEMGLDDESWRTFARGANRIGQAVHDATGLRTVFHHHCGGYVETPDEISRLLDLTDGRFVGLVLDTGHYAYGAGGCDTLPNALDRYADRIDYVHFKDFDPEIGARARTGQWDYFEAVRQGVFCELGQGCVDFAAVTAWMRGRDYQGYVTVEQDVLPGMGAPRLSAQRNRDYLRTIGL